MCGRFALTSTPQQVRALFDYVEEPNFPPREQIAPTEPIGVVVRQGGERHFALMRWGFLPEWVKDAADFPLLFNARAETAPEKPAFRNAIRRRRCLVPADSFVEWRREGEGRAVRRDPFIASRADGAPLALGGIWETNLGPDGAELDTVAILTTDANGTLGAIHDRMPVILEPRDFDAWLDPANDDAARVAHLMRPAADDVLVLRAVERSRPVPAPKPRKVVQDDPQGRLF
jgi:putative SOS response-associated peptidase YedK